MKTFLKLTAVLAIVAVLSVGAQEIPRPLGKSALTISTAYTVVGSSTTNVPVGDAPIIPVGKNGVGFYLRVAGTNAATTTNATVLLEQLVIVGGITNVIDTHTFGLSVPQNGTTGHDVYTNIQPTSANFANAPLLRIRSIQNTNLASIFLSNVVAFIRE